MTQRPSKPDADARPEGGSPAGSPSGAEREATGAATTPPCADLPLSQRVEAVLFASERPLSDARLVEVLGLPPGPASQRELHAAMEALNAAYADSGRAFRIESVSGGRRVMTIPELEPVVERLHGERQQTKLSQAAIETLAIIAYRQPIMRAELEAIRGVSCGEVLRGLMERRLVRICGRAEIVGRPMLYGTTREFLQVFGLSSLDDLPALEGEDDKGGRRRGRAAREGSAGLADESRSGAEAESLDAHPEAATPEAVAATPSPQTGAPESRS